MTSKKDLSERDICSQFILPALIKSGWDPEKQIREEVFFTDGRVFVKGNKTVRGERKRADYILYLKPNIPIAVIEAKDNNHSVDAGIQQALGYAQTLDVPVAFSSNGDGFIQHDRSGLSQEIEKELPLDSFPSPAELWTMYKKYKHIETPEEERVASYDYYFDGTGTSPVIISKLPSIALLKPLPKDRTEFFLSWLPAPGKPILLPDYLSSLEKRT